MNRGQSFVAYAQSPELMQPGDGPFDYPTGPSQITAMRCSTLGNVVPDAAFLQCLAVGTTIVSTIGLNGLGLFQRPPALSSNWVDTIDQRQQLRDVMPVRLGQNDVDRDALRIDEEVVLAARLTAIGWVGSTFFPPCTARTDELSATAREKSSLSAPRNLSRSTQCSLRHTPAFCQARSRRQQVMPEPHPISLGSISHGRPDCRMNRMPVRTRSSSRRLRPAGDLCGGGGGSKGWKISHSASSTSSRVMASSIKKHGKTL